MNVSLILIILLVGAFITYFAGDKLASKVALFFSFALGCSVVLLNHFNAGENISLINAWITQPKISFALNADGLAAMLLLTTAFPIIIFSSFGNEYKNSKAFYSLILFMAFAMTGTFLLRWSFILYFLGASSYSYCFIALIWGNGDADERRKAVVKFFIYTLAGSLFMLTAFIYLYQKAGAFLIEDYTK
jgi:NADH-quinone oxidoreductase subunit M